MAKVKISAIGLLDMLYFKGKKTSAKKRILQTEAKPLVEEYASNLKAAERHPESQTFVIDEVIERGGGNVKTYVLKRKDGGKPFLPRRAVRRHPAGDRRQAHCPPGDAFLRPGADAGEMQRHRQARRAGRLPQRLYPRQLEGWRHCETSGPEERSTMRACATRKVVAVAGAAASRPYSPWQTPLPTATRTLK